jgi:hypothetical protein
MMARSLAFLAMTCCAGGAVLGGDPDSSGGLRLTRARIRDHRMINNGGSTSRANKCSAATTGNACTNQRRLRQEDLVPAAVRELKRVLLQTDLHDKLREKIRARLKTFRLRADDERPKLEKALAKLDAEMNRLVTFIRGTDATTNPGAYEMGSDLTRGGDCRAAVADGSAQRDRSEPPTRPTAAQRVPGRAHTPQSRAERQACVERPGRSPRSTSR